MDTSEEGNVGCGSCDSGLWNKTFPPNPVPLPDPVFWGGYPTSVGTGVLSCAEQHSFNKSQCLLYGGVVRIDSA